MKTIETFAKDFNSAWQNKGYEESENMLHDDVVFYKPGFEKGSEGKEECLRTLTSFADNSNVHKFEIDETIVDSWDDDTAVISYTFKLQFSTEGDLYQESGRDLLMLKKVGEDWKILRRSFV